MPVFETWFSNMVGLTYFAVPVCLPKGVAGYVRWGGIHHAMIRKTLQRITSEDVSFAV